MYSYIIQGVDSSLTSTNYGGNYIRDYNGRPSSKAPMSQGVKNTVSSFSIDASYMLWHILFLEARILIRNETNELWSESRNNSLFTFGMRMNMARPHSRI